MQDPSDAQQHAPNLAISSIEFHKDEDYAGHGDFPCLLEAIYNRKLLFHLLSTCSCGVQLTRPEICDHMAKTRRKVPSGSPGPYKKMEQMISRTTSTIKRHNLLSLADAEQLDEERCASDARTDALVDILSSMHPSVSRARMLLLLPRPEPVRRGTLVPAPSGRAAISASEVEALAGASASPKSSSSSSSAPKSSSSSSYLASGKASLRS